MIRSSYFCCYSSRLLSMTSYAMDKFGMYLKIKKRGFPAKLNSSKNDLTNRKKEFVRDVIHTNETNLANSYQNIKIYFSSKYILISSFFLCIVDCTKSNFKMLKRNDLKRFSSSASHNPPSSEIFLRLSDIFSSMSF